MRIRKVVQVVIFSLCAFSAFAKSININTAPANEIAEAMVGVGKAKAAAIIAYRKANGPFKAVADVVKVKGIGEKTLAKNKEKLAVH